MTTLIGRDLTLIRPPSRGVDGPRTILDGVEAHFPSGSFNLIVGAIGSGKTTLLHLFAALLRPTRGVVIADGQEVSRYSGPHRDRWRRNVGLAFQTPLAMAELSALENVMLPLIPRVATLGEARRRALHQLESFQVAHLQGRSTASLSGGERQRITLARALVAKPSLILADEPTAHQDPEGARQIMAVLDHERARGATLVVVSHDTALIDNTAAASEAIWRLHSGKLHRLESKPALREEESQT
ncbi:MAG: ATP-binding cassette domain-containing protein [Myxococcota bacterium]